MPSMMLVRRGDVLAPAHPTDLDEIRKLPLGKLLKGDVTCGRNNKFMRKYFALLNMAFEYWNPDTLVTKTERDTVVKFGKFMTANGLPRSTALTLCKQFMENLNSKREYIEAEKSMDAFRDWVAVEAGFYRTVKTPTGLRKEPRSISFAKMTEESFAELYKAAFAVLWKLILSKEFPSEAEAENAVANLLSYD